MISVALDCEHERQSEAGVTRASRALAEALSVRSDVELHLVGGGSSPRRGTIEKRLLTLRQDFFWYPFAGRRLARKLPVSVYHCPSPRAPVTRGKPPLVVTVHDLASFRYPETLTRWTRLYERATLPVVTRAAERIIAVSEDTAADLQRMLRVPARKITVIHNGVESALFAPRASLSPFPFPYVLFVGTPQPRKNLARLCAAVRLLARRGHDLKLVVAGSDGWGESPLTDPEVIFAGRVDDATLAALYQHAECLALVSLHEGFGLPALEAMAAGCPVVAARAGALPEIVGGAAVLVDPLDTESIASGILEARGQSRQRILAAAVTRVEAFSWARTAELTVAVYKELQ